MIEKIPFGRTGHKSTRAIFGGAALYRSPREEAEKALETIKDYGINHIDTSVSYGKSEEHIGRWMKDYREDFFLATKLDSRGYEKGKAEIQESLDNLNVEKFDLLQMHELVKPSDLEAFFEEDGAMKALKEAKDQGITDYTGVTSHGPYAPKMMLECLEKYDFDSVLLPLNYTMMGIPKYSSNFKKLLEVCKERNIAIQTTKSVARRSWGDMEQNWNTWYQPLETPENIEKAVHWVLSHDNVFICTVGDVDLLPRVLDAVESYDGKAPSDEEMDKMVEELEMEPLKGWPRLEEE